MKQVITEHDVRRQSAAFEETGGASAGNRSFGFAPAFYDRENARVYLCRTSEGAPAPVHQFTGLPQEVVAERDASGRPVAIKRSLVAGFVRSGQFYSREQAAQIVEWELDKSVAIG